MDENDNILAYKKFMVLEKKVTVQANVSKGTLAKNRKTKHEIDVKIDHPNFNN